MDNKLVLLRSDKDVPNVILKVLGQFRTNGGAKQFIEEEYPEFRKDICQYSKFQSPEFITIE